MISRFDRTVHVDESAAALVAADPVTAREALTRALLHLNRARQDVAEVRYGYGIRPADYRAAVDGIERMQLVTKALLARSRQHSLGFLPVVLLLLTLGCTAAPPTEPNPCNEVLLEHPADTLVIRACVHLPAVRSVRA